MLYLYRDLPHRQKVTFQVRLSEVVSIFEGVYLDFMFSFDQGATMMKIILDRPTRALTTPSGHTKSAPAYAPKKGLIGPSLIVNIGAESPRVRFRSRCEAYLWSMEYVLVVLVLLFRHHSLSLAYFMTRTMIEKMNPERTNSCTLLRDIPRVLGRPILEWGLCAMFPDQHV